MLNTFFKNKINMELMKVDLNFLRKCKKRRLHPKFCNIKFGTKNFRTEKIAIKSKNKLLKKEADMIRGKLAKIEIETYNLHLQITKYWTSDIHHKKYNSHDEFFQQIQDVTNTKVRNKNIKLNKKFKKLLNGQKQQDAGKVIRIDGMIINKSSVNLMENELELLNQGLNHAIKSSKPPIKDIIVDIESSIKNLPYDTKNEIRVETKQIIEKFLKKENPHNSKNIDQQTIKQLKTKNLSFIKADKNNSIIILDDNEYDRRVEKMIEDGPYTKITKSPLNLIQRKTIEIINETATNLNMPHLKYILKVQNPRIPTLHCTLKTHKTTEDLRPICSNINAPTDKLAKWLIKEFNKIKKPAGFDIKNSIELVKKLKNLKITRNECLISFDVKSLYPSIPINKALEYLERWLLTNKIPYIITNIYIKITKLCIEEAYFQFRKNYYKQDFGVAMGNPISSFIANLFMCYYETELSQNESFPRVWYRYVDDVIAVVSKRKIPHILTLINSKHKSIQFTYEEEKNGELPFLEIKLIRKNTSIEFDIYRKPTFLPRYITNVSNHHENHKKAAFYAMAYRLTNIPLSEFNFKKEYDEIIKIGKINGYKKRWVEKIIKKMKRKADIKNLTTLNSIVESHKNKKIIATTYYPVLTEKIKNNLKRHNIIIVNKSKNKLKEVLNQHKDKREKEDESGIYKINCNDCDKMYIGQTKRQFSIRYKEHERAYKNKEEFRSAMAKHALEEGHHFNKANFEVVEIVNITKNIDAVESIAIQRIDQGKLINLDNGPVSSLLFKLIN